MAIPVKRKRKRLVEKVKHCWERTGLPRYLHRYGPKKFESWYLAFCWLLTQKYTRSLRLTLVLLFEMRLPLPHWTTIQKAAQRWPLAVWQALQRLSAAVNEVYIAAVDSTRFSLTNPSLHYLNRIQQSFVPCPVHVSVLVDTRRGHILACRHRVRYAGDAKDVPYLLRHTPVLPAKLVGDAAYNVEKTVFRECDKRSVIAVIKHHRGRKRGRYRKKMRKHFHHRTYARRNIAESIIGKLKQRYGGSFRCRSARTQRAELYARVILLNLEDHIRRLFLQSPR